MYGRGGGAFDLYHEKVLDDGVPPEEQAYWTATLAGQVLGVPTRIHTICSLLCYRDCG